MMKYYTHHWSYLVVSNPRKTLTICFARCLSSYKELEISVRRVEWLWFSILILDVRSFARFWWNGRILWVIYSLLILTRIILQYYYKRIGVRAITERRHTARVHVESINRTMTGVECSIISTKHQKCYCKILYRIKPTVVRCFCKRFVLMIIY